MPTILITGASRGIGLALATQYADAGWQVIATCRSGAIPALADKTGVSVHPLDVTDPAQVAALAGELAGTPIDLLFNNAGVYGPRDKQSLGAIDYDAWLPVMETNVIAPVRVAEAFAGHVAASERKIIAIMSSVMGSNAETSGGAYIYRTSKAAVNMAMRCLAGDLAARGITLVALHPGWVRTDMGGAGAAIDVETSASGLRRVLDGLEHGDSGRFLRYDGTEIPW